MEVCDWVVWDALKGGGTLLESTDLTGEMDGDAVALGFRDGLYDGSVKLSVKDDIWRLSAKWESSGCCNCGEGREELCCDTDGVLVDIRLPFETGVLV